MHPAMNSRARKVPIIVFYDARILRILAAIRHNLFHVQYYCVLAAAFLLALTSKTNIVSARRKIATMKKGTFLAQAAASCDYGLSSTMLYANRSPPQSTAPKPHQLPSDMTFD